MAENATRGKKNNQKLKPYVVLQYLLKYSDEDHAVSATTIHDYLLECGIDSERRSIYRDIDEINRVSVMIENDCTIDEATKMLENDEADKIIIYDKSKKGFYARRLNFDPDDVRLLVEAIYAAKFISKSKVDELNTLIRELISDYKAEEIFHDVYLTDRVKTNNNKILYNVSTINAAMQYHLYGEPHTPEKISFKYLTHTIGSAEQVERRHGKDYVVSPYKLLINEGNYYLLAYDDTIKNPIVKTFRVDRMKGVKRIGAPRTGQEAFDKIDLRTYTQRTFSMYGGELKSVTMSFTNDLLDSVIDRFGTSGAQYFKINEECFGVTATIQASKTFYGWLLSYGDKAMITAPQGVIDSFKEYVDKIRSKYD